MSKYKLGVKTVLVVRGKICGIRLYNCSFWLCDVVLGHYLWVL